MIQLSTTRRLVEHNFDHDGHIYHVPGEFTLSTSDVIELNGLSDVSMVPLMALEHAGHRGSALHKAVEAFESGEQPELAILNYANEKYPKCKQDAFVNEVMERLWFYRSWRAGRTIKLAGDMELPRVYRHEGSGYLIGATIDMPVFIDGCLTILDLKTGHRNDGVKAQMDALKWRLQTQSYAEALTCDESFWQKVKPQQIFRAVLHLHPKCGKNGTRGTQSGFDFHPFGSFDEEDPFLWDGAVRLAMARIQAGVKLSRRNTNCDLKADLRASLEVEEQPIF